MNRFERPALRAMTGYTFGEQPQDGSVIKLNTNENPYAPSPAIAEALARFDVATLRRYPSPFAQGFRETAAALHGLTADWVMATNGGDELLRLLITTYLEPGQPLATTEPSYSLYPVLAAVQGCPTVTFDLEADFALPEDLGARAQAAGAGLFCLVNPHAPTGRLFTEGALERLLSQFSGVVLIDQAYVDFIDEDQKAAALGLIQRHDRVLLLRTLSKGYALAGLRFGYGLAQPSLLEPMLTKTRDSYNVDAIAQTLATAALKDQAWAQENWATVRRERAALKAALAARGYEAPPSQTNFLFPTVPSALDAATIKDQLKAAGILVRHFPGALGQRLRITVGTAEENAALLAALPGAP